MAVEPTAHPICSIRCGWKQERQDPRGHSSRAIGCSSLITRGFKVSRDAKTGRDVRWSSKVLSPHTRTIPTPAPSSVAWL